MPIYEYTCSKCQEKIEVIQGLKDPPPKKCPSCGQNDCLSKDVSSSSFHLKGGGWYKDLYSSTKPEQKKQNTKKTPAPAKKDTKSK